MDILRAQADVILTGSTTLKAFPKCYKINSKNLPASARKKMRQPANVILTASGKLDADMPFWNDPETVRFIFTTEEGFAKAFEVAKERAFVIKAGRGRVDLNLVIARLKQSGLRHLLVEGGGDVIAQFLQENLLHEMNVTLTPWVIGGRENPSLVGGLSQMPWKKLKLLSVKKVKDELYLRYQVKGSKRV